LKIYEKREDNTRLFMHAIELARRLIDMGDNSSAKKTLQRVCPLIGKSGITDSSLFQIAAFCERVEEWGFALNTYECIIKAHPESAFFPKSLFCAGKILKEKLKNKEGAQKYFQQLLKPPFREHWSDIVNRYAG
jgi:hypothetical protein